MANRVSSQERDRIIAALRADESRSHGSVAREFGRGGATVSRIAAAAGIDPTRSRTKTATEARTTDIRARLSALADNLVADAERLRGQLFVPMIAFAFGGKDNDYNEHEIPEPTARDKQALMTSIGIAVDKARQITASDAPGGEEARGLVRELLDGVQDWAASQPAAAPSE